MSGKTEQDKLGKSPTPVYALMGFMGAGKSTLGRAAARDMGRTFWDVDEQIEQSEGMAIRTIFELKGEAYFREVESAKLKETVLRASPGSIISLGGGAPCFHDNLDFLKANAVTIFLDISAEELARRLEPNRSERPLLRHLSAEEFLDWIRNKLRERDAWYRQAEVVLTADNLSASELIQWIQWHEAGFLR